MERQENIEKNTFKDIYTIKETTSFYIKFFNFALASDSLI